MHLRTKFSTWTLKREDFNGLAEKMKQARSQIREHVFSPARMCKRKSEILDKYLAAVKYKLEYRMNHDQTTL